MSVVVSESAGVRSLHFGSRWLQGAMRLAAPHDLEIAYTRDMVLPLALRADPAWPRSVCVVGLGAGSFVRWIAKHRPRAAVTAIEVDPAVVSVARTHFRLPPDGPRLRIVTGDAVEVVPRLADTFDLILVDAYDPRGSSAALETATFYRACRDRLAAGGWLAANLFDMRMPAAFRRLDRVFDGGVRALRPCETSNTVIFGARDPGDAAAAVASRDAVRALRASTGLDLRDAAKRLRRYARPGVVRLFR